jgi:hypothetical protein
VVQLAVQVVVYIDIDQEQLAFTFYFPFLLLHPFNKLLLPMLDALNNETIRSDFMQPQVLVFLGHDHHIVRQLIQ